MEYLRQMELCIAVHSTRTFSSRFLAGVLAYCRRQPDIRPRIVRLQGEENPLEQTDAIEGDAIVFDYRFQGVLAQWAGKRVPMVVQCFTVSADIPMAQVGFNNEAIGEQAAERLLEQGLQQLLFVGNRVSSSSSWRWRGFQRAALRKGRHVEFFRDGPKQRGASRISLRLQMQDLVETLRSLEKPVGIFATDDTQGERVNEAAHLAGLQVPREVAIVCVSSTPLLCAWSDPPLSAFHLDLEAQGMIAAEWAHRSVLGPAPEGPPRFAPWQYKERESTSHLAHSDPLIGRALRLMAENLGLAQSTAALAASLHVSKKTLERRFHEVCGKGPGESLRDTRIRLTLQLLGTSEASLKEICLRAGWSDPSHMGRAVKAATGLAPGQYRSQFSKSTIDNLPAAG